jgi:excisionase family DNA binding protein
MDIPMTPPQAAKKLGVAIVTVYKWIESGKLAATQVPVGSSKRIYIDPKDIDLKAVELAEAALRVDENTPRADGQSMEWVRLYQDLIGKVPPLYVAFRNGKATLDQMKAEAARRFDLLR